MKKLAKTTGWFEIRGDPSGVRLYSAFADYHQKGIPPVRSMLLSSPELGRTVEDNSQFMFGRSILVAPFYEQFATKRSIRLPSGDWYDFYSDAKGGSVRDAVALQAKYPDLAIAGEWIGNAEARHRRAERLCNRRRAGLF